MRYDNAFYRDQDRYEAGLWFEDVHEGRPFLGRGFDRIGCTDLVLYSEELATLHEQLGEEG